MYNKCHTIDNLLVMSSLDVADHGRAHLDSCPRCQAQLATYLEFMAADQDCNSEQLELANIQLEQRLNTEIFGDAVNDKQTPNPKQPALKIGWIRTVMLAAASVLVFFAVSSLWDNTDHGKILLRSDPLEQQTTSLQLFSPTLLATGSLAFTWETISEADSYLVTIYNVSLDELTQIPVDSGNRTIVAPNILSTLPGNAGAWTVSALSAGDVIAVSQPMAFNYKPEP